MAKYLIARLSAIGDVAMTLPIVYAVARANPEHQFTMLTQPFLTTIIIDPPANLEAMAIDIKREEKRLLGLLRYGKRLRTEAFDGFIDLHDVLRTRVLRIMACWLRPHVGRWIIHKPRRERRRLMNPTAPRDLSPIPPMLELYRETLERAGLRVPEHIPPISVESPRLMSALALLPQLTSPRNHLVKIGIAPFASTDSKTYDLGLMERVVAELSRRGDYEIFLFGGRGQEAETLTRWRDRYERVESVAGLLELGDELAVMSRLDCMLSMDSANMHLASMVGTRVISVWCGTHPSAGFLGLGQRIEDCLQPEGLACRPCSIFGKVRHCEHGDLPCRRGLSPEQIVNYLAIHTQPMQIK